jgi:hypothetical protein
MKKLSSLFAGLAILFALASAFTKAELDPVYGFYGNPDVLASPAAGDMIQSPLLNSSSQPIDDVTEATSRAATLELCLSSENICLAKFQRDISNADAPIGSYQSQFVEGTWAQ